DKQDTIAAVDQGEAAGGLLDQEYETAYEELQHTYDRLVTHVKNNFASNNATLEAFSWTSILLVVIVFTLLSLLLYRIQKKNDTMDRTRAAKLEEESNRISSLSEF